MASQKKKVTLGRLKTYWSIHYHDKTIFICGIEYNYELRSTNTVQK